MAKQYKLGDKWPCECGREHELGVYVAAHWREALEHTCECGRKHIVQRGVVRLIKSSVKKGSKA